MNPKRMTRYGLTVLMIFTIFISSGSLFPASSTKKKSKIDRIVVIKHRRQLIVYSKGIPLKTYRIALGKQPLGKKRFEGDMKTPEGTYYIDSKNPNSQYHKNLGISYPNREDQANARNHGRSAGGQIKIHGLKNGREFWGRLHRLFDWTRGCIAVTNEEIDELYQTVPIGTLIEIRK